MEPEPAITELEAKARLMAVCPAAIGLDHIIQGCGHAEAGFVVWDASPPSGVPWHIHRQSFMEAIHTALAFCGTDTRDEWCVLGAVPLLYMRSMPGFEQVEAVACHPFVYIGRHKTTLMYTDAAQHRPPRGGNEFICGVRNRAARGLIQNAPINMA
jgi:hypothetical protein